MIFTCPECGKQMNLQPAIAKKKKYCSKECHHAAKRRGRPLLTKVCQDCGAEFKTIIERACYCLPCRHKKRPRKPRMMYPAYCIICGKFIKAYSASQYAIKYCSPECRAKGRKNVGQTVKKTCTMCGKTYCESSNKRSSKCKECRINIREGARLLKEHMFCDNCGVPVPRGKQAAARRNNIFCSKKCWHEYTRKDKPIHEIKCARCGKTIYSVNPHKTKCYACQKATAKRRDKT